MKVPFQALRQFFWRAKAIFEELVFGDATDQQKLSTKYLNLHLLSEACHSYFGY